MLPAARAKGISLHLISDAGVWMVTGDPQRLQQVIWNLLANAIKFTPVGGRVEVEIRYDRQEARIQVRDTGEGISEDFLPFVFDRFRQANSSSTRKHGGLGLGLAIVRHLVELHGGTVTVESNGRGCGTSFTVRLPLRAAQADSVRKETATAVPFSSKAQTAPASLQGLRVMIVDDEPDTRDLLQRVLRQYGAEVMTAGSCAEAIRLVQQQPPDVLVSDIGMPGEDGYDLISRVRALEASGRTFVPAIAVTGYSRSEDGARALATGYQKHLSKPVEPDRLVTTIYQLAGNSRPALSDAEVGAVGTLLIQEPDQSRNKQTWKTGGVKTAIRQNGFIHNGNS